MTDSVNTTLNMPTSDQLTDTTYDDNKDIIWPTVMGIFVALALGWMICRYKCSSKERSPHIVRCCPKSLCKNLRACCSCFCKHPTDHKGNNMEQRASINKARPSNNSIQEIPFLLGNRSSLAQATQQWPPPFLLDQTPSFPLSIAVQAPPPAPPAPPPPKRHPLRRESVLPNFNNERRESSLWPFRTLNAVFHRQTSEIKENDLFFSA